MKPIYFPFTHIYSQVLKILKTYFNEVIVYSPYIKKDPDDSILDFIKYRFPVQGQEGQIKSLLKQYKEWAGYNQGQDLKFLQNRLSTPPFFDEDSTAEIRSKILKNKKNDEKISPSLRARLFMALADEFDKQEDDLKKYLHIKDKIEIELFDELKHQKSAAKDINQIHYKSGSTYNIEARISSWATLMQQDEKAGGVYITACQDCLDYLLEFAVRAFELTGYQSEAYQKDKKIPDLNSSLQKIAKAAWIDSSKDSIEFINPGDSLKLYIVPGIGPRKFFKNLTKSSQLMPDEFKNTIIGIVYSA